MQSVFFFCVAALVAVATPGRAFKVVGAPSYQNYITNGVISQNQTVTVMCEATDLDQTFTLQVTKTSGATVPVTVKCNAPVISFNVAVKGYIPTDGISTCEKACTIRGISVVTPGTISNFTDRSTFVSTNPNFLNTATAETVDSNSGIPTVSHIQRLMRIRKEQDEGNHEFALQTNMAHARHLLQIDPGSFALATVAYAIAFVALVQVNVLSHKVDNLQAEADSTKTALSNYVNETNIWRGQTDTQLQTLNTTLYTTYAIQQQQQAANKATTDGLSAALQSNIALTSALNSNFTVVYRNLTALSTQLQILNSLVNASATADGSQFALFQARLANLTTQVNWAVQNLSSSTQTNFQTAFLQIRQAVSNIRDLAGIMQAGLNQTPLKRAIARDIAMSLLRITNAGQYTPFLENYGALPTTDLSSHGQLYIDNFRLLFIGSNNFFYQVDMQIYCALGWTMQSPQGWTSWLDFFEAIGPPGCDPTLFQCQCYVTAETASCARNSSFGQSDIVNAGQLTGDMCNGHVFNSPVHSPVLNTANNFTNFLASVCQLGATSGYQVISLRQMINTTAVYSASVCTMDYNSMLMINQAKAISSQNFAYAILNIIPNSFDKVFYQIQANLDAVDGVLPPNLSEQYLLMQTIETQPATCLKMCFMSYSGPMIPIYALTQPVATTDVVVNVDGVIYDEYDAVVREQIGYNLLPQYILAGPPGGPGSGNIVYDVSLKDSDLDPAAPSREGRPTYPLTNDPNNFTVVHWMASNGVTFDHTKGTNVAKLYQRQLVNVTTSPKCNLGTGQLAGTVCTMLQSLSLVTFNPSSQFAKFEMKTAAYLVQIPVPDGQVFLLQNSGCPQTQVLALSASTIILSMSNAFTGPIFVDVVLTGDCQNQWNNVQIPALGTYSLPIPACNSGNQQQYATLYQVAGANRGAVCASATNLDVHVNRTEVLQVQGMADLSYVVSQTTTAQDSINAQLISQQIALNGVLSELVVLNIQSAAPQLMSNPVLLNNFGDIISSLNELGRNITANTNALSGQLLPNFTALTQGYNNQIGNSLDRLAVINTTYTALMQQFADEIANYNAGQKLLLDDNNRTTIAGAVLVKAMSAWIDGVTSNFNKQASVNVMDGFTGLLEFPQELGEGAYNIVKRFVSAVANEVAKDAGSIAGFLAGTFGGILQIGSIIVSCVIAAAGLYYVFKYLCNRRRGNVSTTSLRPIEDRVEHMEKWLVAFAAHCKDPTLVALVGEANEIAGGAIHLGHMTTQTTSEGAVAGKNRRGYGYVSDSELEF